MFLERLEQTALLPNLACPAMCIGQTPLRWCVWFRPALPYAPGNWTCLGSSLLLGRPQGPCHVNRASRVPLVPAMDLGMTWAAWLTARACLLSAWRCAPRRQTVRQYKRLTNWFAPPCQRAEVERLMSLPWSFSGTLPPQRTVATTSATAQPDSTSPKH